MPVIEVRELDRLLKSLEPGHHCIADMGIHQTTHPDDFLLGQIGPGRENRPLHLIQNPL